MDPEAARLLRPGGRLVFMCGSTLLKLCSGHSGKTEQALQIPQFGMHRFEWEGEEPGVEFEVRAPEAAEEHPRYDSVTADWARRWPSEEIRVARKCA